MKILRTPDARFENLPDYDFEPNYIDIDGLRMHYVAAGPEDGAIVLLLHGEPSWSYLYRHMIPPLRDAGFRVIAPDLIGFGKSDKPTDKSDYTYAGHVAWMQQFIEALNLHDITLFCQDWGSLIGLRVAAENEQRFARIALGNGGLPTGDQKLPTAFKVWQNFAQAHTERNCFEIIGCGSCCLRRTFPVRTIQGRGARLSAAGPINPKRPGHSREPSGVEDIQRLGKTIPDNLQQSGPDHSGRTKGLAEDRSRCTEARARADQECGSLPAGRQGAGVSRNHNQACSGLALEVLELVFHFAPFVGIIGRIFHLGDHRPVLCQFFVELEVVLLPFRQLVFGVNSLYRALRLAQCTVDTLVGIDHEKVRAFVEAVHGANLDAVGQFALNTGFCNNECHAGNLNFRSAYAMRSRAANQAVIYAYDRRLVDCVKLTNTRPFWHLPNLKKHKISE